LLIGIYFTAAGGNGQNPDHEFLAGEAMNRQSIKTKLINLPQSLCSSLWGFVRHAVIAHPALETARKMPCKKKINLQPLRP